MKNKIKLLLYIQPVDIDGDVSYDVYPPAPGVIHGTGFVHEWHHDPSTRTRLRVDFLDRKGGTQSHLKITKIMAGDIDITSSLQTSPYIRHDTKQPVTGTYGYMSWPGSVWIQVRYSPLVHQYVTNFYQKSLVD